MAGIRHPQLYLWDSWSFSEGGCIHLYCLAVNRVKDDGEPLLPQHRNDFQFHIRHFESLDGGDSWRDKGVFQRAALAADGHDARNVWSGSIMQLADSRVLAAYTGLQELGEQRPFVQSLAVGLCADGNVFTEGGGQLLLCPVRDHEQIAAAGYFMAVDDQLGSVDGEEGGPILAWRDPFCFSDAAGQLYMAWAAKVSAKRSAMGLASIRLDDAGVCQLETLFPPVVLPDDDEYTQLELPKIYFDSVKRRYLLIAASSTRQTEGQSDDEVSKCIRLYVADSLTGPWLSGGTETSVIAGLDALFGLAVIEADYSAQRLRCMVPYTEVASAELALSFSAVRELDISGIGTAKELSAFSC
jgi:hypothetical protein